MITIAVHGFGFDPDSSINHPDGFFGDIEAALDRSVEGFEYFSAPIGPRWRRPVLSTCVTLSNLFKSWRAGERHPYRWAYNQLAPVAAKRLAQKIDDLRGACDIVCHSLGSLVAIEALRLANHPCRRLLILNGAMLTSDLNKIDGKQIAERVLNVVVWEDDVLAVLGRRATGRKEPPIGAAEPAGMPDWWENYRLVGTGDNPDSLADHSWSYKNPANWGVLRGFLDVQ